MHTRNCPVKVGARAWVSYIHNGSLPLPDRAPVTVVSGAVDPWEYVVQAEDGISAVLRHYYLDAGREYLLPGHGWVHESHPTAAASLRSEIAKLRNERWDSSVEWVRHETISNAEFVLSRNGAALLAE